MQNCDCTEEPIFYCQLLRKNFDRNNEVIAGKNNNAFQ